MFERLVDFVLGTIQMFQFWHVVNQYEKGVVLRLGKFYREIGPGLRFTIPFWVDVVMVDNVVMTTRNLGPQSLITKDGVQVVVSSIITWKINDIRKILLEVESSDQVLTDVTYGTIGELVSLTDWEDVKKASFAKKVARKARNRARPLGIEIVEVYLSDKANCISLRLWQEQT